MRFDLAQGSHQALKKRWETIKKVGTEEKTDSINSKELNPTWIEKKKNVGKEKSASLCQEFQCTQAKFDQ